jgi:hypothetical protein
MPLPTAGDVHVNRPLTNISVAFIQKQTNFVADQVFPIVPVDKQSDAYFSYDQAYWNRDEMKDRAPSTESEGNGYAVDATATYYCKLKAFHKDIADPIRANQDAPLNLDREATEYNTLKALIKRETEFAAAYMAAAVWTRDFDGVSSSPTTNEVLQWNDAASTPIEDVWDAKESILQSTGFEPNVLCIGYPVFKALKNHADIVDRIKAGQTPGGPAVVTTNDLAQVFDVEKVVVMRAIRNTALEGAAKSNAFIGGKKALLTYAPPSPGLMTPSGGYMFTWTGYLGAGAAGQRIKTFRMEHLASDRVEIEIAYDMKLVSADLGAFWDSLVA